LQAEKTFGIPLSSVRSIPINVHPREIPEWTQDNGAVKRFILHRFPNAFKRKRIHLRGAELAAVISFYFRCPLSCEEIPEELGCGDKHVVGVAADARAHGDQSILLSCPA